MEKLKKSFCLLLALIFIIAAQGCSKLPAESKTENETENDDIFILFTNDVHCGLEDDIGYAGLAAYKKELSEKHKYVTLVDCGDHIQGGYVGTVTKGEYLIEVMNEVGYDYSAIGNHEFDYGAERLAELIRIADAEYLCCNIRYIGKTESLFKDVKPYAIKEYGDKKVAFIGISTPLAIINSTPSHFFEDGECAYDFCSGNDGKNFYSAVQNAADLAKADGADYVVALSHVGYDETTIPYDICSLAENTCGIDIFLDAHSHTELPCLIEKNSEGEEVLISSTGTKLNNIGQLVITASGNMTVGYISDYAEKDAETAEFINKINAAFNDKMDETVGHTDVTLTCVDGSGIRMVRSRETNIGDFTTDAFRYITGADIGICNGGGIRADIKAGDILYENIVSVMPYENQVCSMHLTGQEILDYFEYVYSNVQSDYIKDGSAYGENGSFMQVSGIKLTINTDIPSSVVVDEDNNFLSAGETRRVSDVTVLKDGEYVPIDPKAVYSVASFDYILKNGGSGTEVFLAGRELANEEMFPDCQTLIDYIGTLGGDFSQYSEPAGRITVK